jgi:hypothetical protein
VNEVNDTMEFRNSIEPTGVDIPEAIVEHVLTQSARGPSAGRAERVPQREALPPSAASVASGGQPPERRARAALEAVGPQRTDR